VTSEPFSEKDRTNKKTNKGKITNTMTREIRIANTKHHGPEETTTQNVRLKYTEIVNGTIRATRQV